MIRKKELRMAAKLAAMLWLAASLSIAQSGSVTIGTASGGNCDPYSCGYTETLTEWQQHFAASAFGVSTPIRIVDFVLSAWAGNGTSVGSDTGTYKIYLSTAVHPLGSDSNTLSSNIGADNVLFASISFGPTMPATFTVTGIAPFNYNPASGDLLIDVQFTGEKAPLSGGQAYFSADDTGTLTKRNYTQGGSSTANDTSGLVTQFDYTSGSLLSQTIAFGPLSNQVYGSLPPALSATASSGLPVSFNSQTMSVCTVSGNTVTLVMGGTCTIQATQSGNADYAAATPVNQSFTVTPAPQSISFAPLSSQVIGSTPPPLSATASSGLPVSFNSLTMSICTVSGTAVTLVGVGTCTIQATQSGNADYQTATPVNRSFTVTQATQTITFGPLSNQAFGTTPPALIATASSGLPVSFNSLTLPVCAVSGTAVTLVGVGTCTIQATQSGNADYKAAAPVNQSFTVSQAMQTITFGALGSQVLGTTPPPLSATASSGLSVSFNSQTPAICTVSGTAVTLVAVGTCTIQATQSGNSDYKAATPVNQSFTVTSPTQTITFQPLSNQPYGSLPPALNATASSGLPVSFNSQTPTICTVTGNSVTLVAPGFCTIQATQAGNAAYPPATPVSQSFTISQASQFITFGGISAQTLGSTPSALSATASSGLPVTFASTTASVCTVSGTTVGLVASGTCTIQATQPGNADYAAATPVTQSFAVTASKLTLTGTAILGGFLPGANISGMVSASGGQPPYTFSATGLPAGFNLNASSGAFSGEAPAPGVYSFTLRVSDSQSPPATASFTVGFSVLGITTSSLPAATKGSSYSQQIVAVGGATPYSFSVTGLPAGSGLSLSGSGLLGGTPSTVGTFSLTVQVTDAKGLSTSATLSLVVTGTSSQPLSVTGGSLPSGSAGSSYSANLTATGGTSPYKWTLIGGALPDGGVTLSGSGAITGTPRTPGTYTFTAQATDAAGATALGTFTITITPETLGVMSTSFPNGTATSPYPLQIMSATGGIPPFAFSITSGSLPAGLTLSSSQISGTPTTTGTFGFTLTVTDSTKAVASAPTSITIKPFSVNLLVSQSTADFLIAVGSNGVPSPASVTVQSNDVSQILNYSVAVSPSVQWLDVTSGTGTTPGSVSIELDPSALSLAASDTPYQTSVNVTCVAPSPCMGDTQTITVSLTVTAPPPQLTLTSSLISFSALTSNPGPQAQPLGIWNTGGGTLDITSVTPADSWLTVTNVPSTLPAGHSVPMTVTADSTKLAANFYQSSITTVTKAGTTVVPVTLNVAQNVTMTLNPSGATIQSVAGNPPGSLTGSFNVNVNGGGSISWSAVVLPGSSWLSVSTPSGTATTGTPGTVNFAIDPTIAAGLSAQAYAGSIQIASSEVVDSPLVFQLYLNVHPAGSPPSPQTSSGGFVFTSNGGGTTAAGAVRADAAASTMASARAVFIYASSKTPVAYQASAATANGGAWLSVSPSTGFTSAPAPSQSVISTNPAGLAPGVYRGGVTYAFLSDAVSTVNITLLVGSQGVSTTTSTTTTSGSSLPAPAAVSTDAAGCAPTKLVATQTGLPSNFAQPAAWPIPVAIAVQDDCLNTVVDAQVTVSFSNGDPPQLMTFNNATQTYVYTWTPRAVASQVTVSGLATKQSLASAMVQITGEVRPNNPPTLNNNTPTHVWDPAIGGSIAPGTIITIYGSNLAAEATPSAGSLTTNLGNTQVLIGGHLVPLYYVSPTQINAQVPFELTAGNQYQVIVVANNVPTATPATVQLTPAVPGVASFTTSVSGLFSQGEIIAQHVADNSLVTEASPAVPGESVVFYLAGLGATDNPVPTGQPAPDSPLSRVLVPLTLTLDGKPLPTEFVGLTPTAVGLYQVDFQVPMGTPAGLLKLVVAQAGLTGNSTLLPVKSK